MPKGSLPGLWKRHASAASIRVSGSVGSPTDGFDCLPHGGLPHAAPGAHGSPDLDTLAPRDARSGRGGIDGAAVCSRKKDGHGFTGAGNLRAAVLLVGWRGT